MDNERTLPAAAPQIAPALPSAPRVAFLDNRHRDVDVLVERLEMTVLGAGALLLSAGAAAFLASRQR